jgi:hypothetical protein
MQTSELETAPEKKYTNIDVLYRDAGNWKTWQTYVVEGQIIYEELEPYLESDARFIGKDVGIEDLMLRDREWPLGSDDHPWLELNEVRPATPAEALQAQQEHHFLGTAEELLQRFKAAQESNWASQEEVTERIELARDQTEGTEARFSPGDQSADDRRDQALRAMRSHNRRLEAAGYTEAQITEIFNAALDKFGREKLTVRNVPEIAAMALQAEVDRLNAGATK